MNTDGKPEQHDTRKRPVIKLAGIILLAAYFLAGTGIYFCAQDAVFVESKPGKPGYTEF